eukprot:TRINITY_DN10704_c0_g2_i1.p1 TRINITY_DN10704_c0_g2~~TRINITY_DN10704_c0_g2_i1.p1  ORF type:complete len:240 (-),score=41.46 TRINITY_DN10704_c0_g2_i1:75-794(-)
MLNQQQLKENERNFLVTQIIALLKEMAIMSYCDHINIAKIRAIYFDPKQFVWIVQPQYYTTLQNVIYQKNLKSIKKKEIICQILEALKYLHNLGLVHLDLKPSNIMFKHKDFKEIVILDFGISNFYKENKSTKIFGLTPYYCPPEIKHYTLLKISPKADIFSFGIIFYEIVSEKDTFINFDENNVYNYIRKLNFNFFAAHQKTGKTEIDEFIERCTHREPSERPTAEEALNNVIMMQIE